MSCYGGRHEDIEWSDKYTGFFISVTSSYWILHSWFKSWQTANNLFPQCQQYLNASAFTWCCIHMTYCKCTCKSKITNWQNELMQSIRVCTKVRSWQCHCCCGLHDDPLNHSHHHGGTQPKFTLSKFIIMVATFFRPYIKKI